MILKQQNVNEISPMEVALEIVLRFLERAYGTLGSREFRIESIGYDPPSGAWRAVLLRTIGSTSERYELMVDVARERPVRFRLL